MNIRDPCSPHDVAGRESDRFQADVTALSEMFPTCDDKTLRHYLRMFRDDPNYIARISNLLLDHSSGLDQGISTVHEHVGNFQEKGSVNQQTERGRDTLQIGAGSDESVVSIDIDKSENSNVCSSAEVVENLQCGNVQVLDEDVCNRKKVISSKQSVLPPSEEMSCSSETDDDLVFIKSVPSPGKRAFHRTFHRTNSGLSSESEERGICIRYKDGAPHPSMKKARKSEVVVIDDELNDGICNQSPNKNTNSRCQPVDRESSSSCNKSASSVTGAISDGDVDDRSQLRGTIVSGSKTNGTGSNEAVLIPRNQVSSSNCVAVSDPSLLDDFESLKKVFPDADPDKISVLLNKYADRPDRMVLVRKELGSIANPREIIKKPVPAVPWFWQLKEPDVIPFSDAESFALEKEYLSRDEMPSGETCKNFKFPGSDKRYDVDFATMTMKCFKGEKTKIYRGLRGSEAMTGKRLVPKDSIAVPTSWQEQTGNVELISVRPGSAEWNRVEGSMKRSLWGAHVADIQRIQNKWLYRKYAIQRHLIKEKNGSTCINEKELFHGTKTTNPALIWQGEDGFDMRYSSHGMWGRGTYFASEASYSNHGFAYHNAERQVSQLFLAHVLTGDSIFLPPNENIKMPPLKEGSNIRYDSVNGVTNGCLVYILYKLDMAYPAYLITYTTGRR
ncbi:PREDICTED: uncharacterized protein LOC107355977 isoform X2 [Acropora digitifera]|nr:PREDICTED: uncharacterized protein LOC107355977 isoform X2 [Acropora digitifera]XP_015778082.1 PREDICTED: uncharacterized protein LOC107355977 isoform X2 [Acropora digitifera]